MLDHADDEEEQLASSSDGITSDTSQQPDVVLPNVAKTIGSLPSLFLGSLLPTEDEEVLTPTRQPRFPSPHCFCLLLTFELLCAFSHANDPINHHAS